MYIMRAVMKPFPNQQPCLLQRLDLHIRVFIRVLAFYTLCHYAGPGSIGLRRVFWGCFAASFSILEWSVGGASLISCCHWLILALRSLSSLRFASFRFCGTGCLDGLTCCCISEFFVGGLNKTLNTHTHTHNLIEC